MQQYKIETEIGPLYVIASDAAVHGVFFKAARVAMTDQPNTLQRKVEAQLKEYFAGTRQAFELPLETQGTKFQSEVWKELQKIPYGKTISYTELARRVKNPNAIRAVGSANGRNPISIIVPCHRVIASDGTLGGFAGGLDNKRKLLTLEKAQFNQRRGQSNKLPVTSKANAKKVVKATIERPNQPQIRPL